MLLHISNAAASSSTSYPATNTAMYPIHSPTAKSNASVISLDNPLATPQNQTQTATLMAAQDSNQDPSITLQYTQGPPNLFNHITFSGFQPNDTLDAWFWNARYEGHYYLNYMDSSGDQTFFICDNGLLAPGTYTITVKVIAPGGLTPTPDLGAVATATYTVTAPSIVLSPISGTAGTTIAIAGTSFTPGGLVNIKTCYAANWVANLTADSSGAISGSFTFWTKANGGVYEVLAVDNYTKAQVGENFTEAAPSLTLNPTQGPAGSTFTFALAGLVPDENVSVGLKYSSTSGASVNVKTDSTGAASGSLTVPVVAPAGTYLVTANDSYGNIISALFSARATTSPMPSPTPSPFPWMYIYVVVIVLIVVVVIAVVVAIVLALESGDRRVSSTTVSPPPV